MAEERATKSGVRILRHMLPDQPQIGQGTTAVFRDGRWEWAKCPTWVRVRWRHSPFVPPQVIDAEVGK